MGRNNRIAGSVFWSFAQTFSSQFVGLIITTILARLVAPEAYGVIAAANVFTSLATTFVAGGFSNALIQKKDADEKDFATMFFFNIAFSGTVYLCIYILAPVFVQLFNESYDYDLLVKVIRVLGVGIFFSSFNAFFRTLQQKELNFKRLFVITMIGTPVSAFVGVFLAYKGFGVWALVAQNVLSYVINCVCLIITTKYCPILYFSFKRLKPMFSYGFKMMLAGLTITVYADITSLVIGNRYSAESLAYYNKGVVYPKLIALNTVTAVNTALFPIMSKMQGTDEIKLIVRKFNRISAFLITPMMFGFAAVGPSFIQVLLGEQWLPASIFLQICCFNYAIQPIAMSSLQYLKATGRANEYLGLDLIRKVVGIVLLVCAVIWNKGVEWIALSELVSNFIAIFINMYPGKKHIGYQISEQIWDVLPKFIISGIMLALVYTVGIVAAPVFVKLVVQILVGGTVYILLAYMFRMRELTEVWQIVKNLMGRKN